MLFLSELILKLIFGESRSLIMMMGIIVYRDYQKEPIDGPTDNLPSKETNSFNPCCNKILELFC